MNDDGREPLLIARPRVEVEPGGPIRFRLTVTYADGVLVSYEVTHRAAMDAATEIARTTRAVVWGPHIESLRVVEPRGRRKRGQTMSRTQAEQDAIDAQTNHRNRAEQAQRTAEARATERRQAERATREARRTGR